MNIIELDHRIISFFRKAFLPFARFSIFVIYTWFGMLKVLGLSLASELVHNLFNATIPIMPFETFYILFALFEVVIGVMFLFPRLTRYVIPLLVLHLIAIFLPLIMLPSETWNGFMVLTMEGQYIVKNLLIIAVAIGIAAQVQPMGQNKK